MSGRSAGLLQHVAGAAALMLVPLAASSAEATEIGAYRGPGCDGRKQMHVFEDFVGRKAERTVDALNQESWAELKSSIPWIAKCWGGSDIELTLSVPMLPKDGSGTLAEGAAGAYDAVFVATARALIQNYLADAVLRIGWEFNGDWMPWTAMHDPESYKDYFRHIVAIMRAAPGQNFRFEWCPNHGRKAMDPTDAYPGDDVVDIIGMDVYAETWDASTRDPERRFAYFLDQPFGLKWHRDFAKQRGKPISYPEWGVGTRPDGHGVGDDPVFIEGMADWFEEVEPLYQSYWDVQASDYNAQMSNGQFPQASAMFKRRFGSVD
ncbi:glycosyl hydrolase [Mesorhizobium sp. KR9-304]|uniref:glycoside hydrolase family 26 protein n=1 Tax=Mesorhizobium sp. KR9-304 TaxID=3156614 RepID=UPI0032B3D4E9